MISKTALNARGQNKIGESVVDYLIVTEAFKADYYKGEEQSMMRWGGKGALALGLIGRSVEKDDMLALAAGFAPDTREALCQNAGELPQCVLKKNRDGTTREVWEGGHRVGFDFTLTPDKDVSLMFALGNPRQKEDVLASHRAAVDKTMSFLESKTETRLGEGGKDVVPIGGLVYSQHDHQANRDHEPNLHTHCLIYGVAQRQDGSWGTYDAKELYRHTRAADVIYQNELAMELRSRGIAIEQREETLKTGEVVRRARIQGISDEMCDVFSKRRASILQYRDEHGVTEQVANLATRKHKDEPCQAELVSLWEETARSLGFEHVMEGLSVYKEDKSLPQSSMNDLCEKLHRTEAAVCDTDLIKLMGNEHMGFVHYEDILARVEEFKRDAGLRVVAPKALHEHDKGKTLSREYSEDRYQAPWLATLEEGIFRGSIRRQNEDRLRLSPGTVEKAFETVDQMKPFKLTDEQRKAVRHLTLETGGVAALEGYAGTGKTTVSDAYKRAFEAEGFSLMGVAISNKAAKKLQDESGMPSMSVTKTLSQLDKGKVQLTNKHVLVVDEAGMLDTVSTSRLMKHADTAGAKIIFQGDTNQIQPIQAGSGFSLVKDAIGAEKLTEIRRQRSSHMRDLAKLYYDHDDRLKSRREAREKGARVSEALEMYGHTEAFSTTAEARTQVAKDYLNHPAAPEDKLILAHTNSDVSDLTKQIREGLREQGKVQGADHTVKCKSDNGFEERQFARGDRILFKTSNSELGVINGTEGDILGIKKGWDGGTEFLVKIGDKKVQFSSYEFNAIDHNYASTIHGAQGQGVDHVMQLYHPGMADSQSMLVGMTRAKVSYKLYGQADDLERLAERIGQDRKKENALGRETHDLRQVLHEMEPVRKRAQAL